MFYIKMMDSFHDGYKLIEVTDLKYIEFSRIGKEDFQSEGHTVGCPVVTLHLNIDGSETLSFYPLGDTYVLNSEGKTISRFACECDRFVNKMEN